MNLVLLGHTYQYAVEQTVMALLPDEKISAVFIVNSPQEWDNRGILQQNYILSEKKEFFHDGTATIQTTLFYQGVTYSNQVTYSLNTRDEKTVEQYAVKESLYLAISQIFPTPPPWGSLTGVRPGKMALKWLKELGDQANIQEFLEKKFYLSPQRSQLVDTCGRVSLQVEKSLAKKGISLYIAIPFCPTRCSYCSFFSADIQQNQNMVQPYLNALIQEICQVGALMGEHATPLTSLYIGGGTPTSLSAPQLRQLLQAVRDHIPLETCQEYTVEAGRPDTITQEKLDILQDFSVDRISINPQTMHDEILQKLGRGHCVEDILQCFDWANGRFSINMDLIAGLPGETVEKFTQSLKQVLQLRPQQITLHTLTPKRGSPILDDLSTFPKENDVESMLQHTWNRLPQENYHPYYVYRQKKIAGGFENVGWSQPGEIGLYNVIMMDELQTVVGLGAGAMSKTVSPLGAIHRLNNPKFPKEYIDKITGQIDKKQQLFSKFNCNID